MEEIYAVIDGGVVTNTIVADASFVSMISGQHQAVIRIDQLEVKPGIGWTYDGQNLIPPVIPPIEEPPADPPPGGQ